MNMNMMLMMMIMSKVYDEKVLIFNTYKYGKTHFYILLSIFYDFVFLLHYTHFDYYNCLITLYSPTWGANIL